MKNLFLLPTDKPSRLYYNKNAKEYALSYSVLSQGGWVISQNIYITNDEKIKERKYALALDTNTVFKVSESDLRAVKKFPHLYKKIILTTDQDLIKDGVQAIDDEFLEWFIKNPSCEFIKITKTSKLMSDFLDGLSFYKIIIPKEEPKQNFILVKEDCTCIDECMYYLSKQCKHLKEEPKQETGKEVADYIDRHIVEAMVEVAKQKMYNEEEVLELFKKWRDFPYSMRPRFEEWFEKFKKK
jgi:hypothetical protein